MLGSVIVEWMLLQVINTFTEAVQTVNIEKAIGKPNTLWVHFAKFYEKHDQVPEVSWCKV